MPISRINAPDGVDRMVDNALAGLGSLSGAVGLGAEASGLSAVEAIPIYGADPDADLLADIETGLRLYGWRSLVSDANGQIVAVDISDTDGDLRAERVYSGVGLERLVKVATFAAKYSDKGDFTLKLVEMPDIKLAALWLDDAESSLFFPYLQPEADGPDGPLQSADFGRLARESLPPLPVGAALSDAEAAGIIDPNDGQIFDAGEWLEDDDDGDAVGREE